MGASVVVEVELVVVAGNSMIVVRAGEPGASSVAFKSTPTATPTTSPRTPPTTANTVNNRRTTGDMGDSGE